MMAIPLLLSSKRKSFGMPEGLSLVPVGDRNVRQQEVASRPRFQSADASDQHWNATATCAGAVTSGARGREARARSAGPRPALRERRPRPPRWRADAPYGGPGAR